MSNMDPTITNGHKKAVKLFHEVIKYQLPTASEEDKFVTNIAGREMIVSLVQSIESNQVQVSDSTIALEVLKAIDIQDDKINTAISANKYLDQLYASIEKALIYYVAEQRSKALLILDNTLTFAQPSEQEYVIYLRCLIKHELMLKTKQINEMEFLNSISSCVPPQKENNRCLTSFVPDLTAEEEINEYKISLYPNPAADKLFLEYNLSETEPTQFIIYDITGKILFQSILRGGIQTEEILNIKLSSGIYLYKITTFDNKIIKQSKLTIIK